MTQHVLVNHLHCKLWDTSLQRRIVTHLRSHCQRRMNWYFGLNVTVPRQFMQPDPDKALPLEIIFQVKVAQKKIAIY